ncbi:unknown protein [Nostoc sp. NIES-3756]|nr:unknown protein [Nostoc sp. NIES-3756]
MTPGAKANQSGRILETNVESILTAYQYFQIGNHVTREYLLNASLLKKRYAKQVYIGNGVYQTSLKVDFLCCGLTYKSLRINY